ncbi:MAG: FKBP-type peptidyl-prolyl cis-trans isomerase [Bacteroidetes bacterium]|jgi:FKBP-type peptidyl-prolyl cis-trans isomerase FkpA|nr:FKBP-type peptidyl-prolyl cis-trans isomerase [Bacteroidota bacterium]
MRIYIPILLAILALAGCNKKKISSQAEEDDYIIRDHITRYGWNAQSTGSGLYYFIQSPGTGTQPSSSSTVKVKYTGTLPDGTVFDQSSQQGATFSLNSVIKGWQEGIPYFKEGGKGYLLIPSALGYGSQATGKIPANSVLIFEIELIDVL